MRGRGFRPFLEEAAELALRPEASSQHERMDLCVVSPGWRFFVGRNERLPLSLIQEQNSKDYQVGASACSISPL